MNSPNNYAHRALVAASGMSPQIITETLYAIAVHQQPAFVPTEIHILTTIEGSKKIQAGLLSKPDGYLRKLVHDYRLDPTMLDHVKIHVVKRAGTEQELNDIIDADDNSGFANLAVEVIRGLSERADLAMHVSLAGGRKTMSYYTGYALSMFGRPQDSLSHVLVPPEYEQCTDFYYPTVSSSMVTRRAPPASPVAPPAPIDARDAKVSLANIPFIRMRDILIDSLPETVRTFDETVEEMGRRSSIELLTFDIEAKKVFLGNDELTLVKGSFDVYAWFAWRKKCGLDPLRFRGGSESMDYAVEYMGFKAAHFGGDGKRFERTCNTLGLDIDLTPLPSVRRTSGNRDVTGMGINYLRDKISNLKNDIKNVRWEKISEIYAPVATKSEDGVNSVEIQLPGRFIQLRGLCVEFSVAGAHWRE